MATGLSPINLGAPGEEISTKDLSSVILRFKQLNHDRLLRVLEFLQPRQHDFLHLLPLLFHQNHPLLPGFVTLETPYGIPDYTPNVKTLSSAKHFAKAFNYQPKTLRTHPIDSIFLMGSVGSMAYSKDSDIDIWLCHQPGLKKNQLVELQKKATAIEKWAETLQIEVHFFLVDSEQFRNGENTPISTESSGETQHYLLLEEFYRTSVYIAGKVPAWWLVPPNQERNYPQYIKHLLDNRFILETDIIDFGGLQDMPVEEFVSATVWHIYKSLSSPHKALLKLLLMESYAAEFPDPQWLCVLMKQAIYDGDFNVDSQDPYLQIYRKVDRYLREPGSELRLDLARECFHYKIMGSSEKALDPKAKVLHENFMKMIAKRWRWPEDLLGNLDSHKFWNIKRASDEHQVIRDHLQHSLQIISKLTGKSIAANFKNNNDIKLLGRKLKAFLETSPGKVEVLTTRRMVHAQPDLLSIAEVLDGRNSHWYLFADQLPATPIDTSAAIHQAEDLLNILSWAVINGLHKKQLNLHLFANALKMSSAELFRIMGDLREFLYRNVLGKDTGLEVYADPSYLKASLLVINLCELDVDEVTDQRIVMSQRSDPLSYGENRRNFVRTVHHTAVSSWGEITQQLYSGLDGFFEALCTLFNQSIQPINPKQIQVICHTRTRGKSIALRVEFIISRLLKCFAESQDNYCRYIIAAEQGYCIFKYQDQALSFTRLHNQNQLLQALNQPQAQFSPIVFDSFVLDQTLIPFLYGYNQAGTVQVFYYCSSRQMTVYVIDEKGSLFVRQHVAASPAHLVIHYLVFLRSLQLQNRLPNAQAIRCYEVSKNSAGVPSCSPAKIKPSSSALDLRVRIVGKQDNQFTLYCNEKAFAFNDAKHLQTIQNYIRNFRNSSEAYPFHITEIDVPLPLLGIHHPEEAQSWHYLNYKQKTEDRLNSQIQP